MKDYVIRSITLPKGLSRDSTKRARSLHGPRGFSKYVSGLIAADLRKK